MASYYEDEAEDDAQRFRELVDAIDSAADFDGKTLAIQHLAGYLPTFHSLPEVEYITSVLKPLIKNSHPTLSHEALEFVVPLISHLRGSIQAPRGVQHIKTAISSLMPTVLERAGDSREKMRELALETLEELGKAAVDASRTTLGRSSSHKVRDLETAWNLFARLLCDVGLMAKSAKIKEQTCKVLPRLRAYQPKLPIKVFLPTLVDLLSDADPFVREASRATIVSLFSTTSPAAKADLKDELQLKNVRKALVDAIVQEISTDEEELQVEDRSATTESQMSETPTSSVPQPVTAVASLPQATSVIAASDDNISPVHVFSRSDLERTFASMLPHFEGKESEHNWLQRENSIIKVRGLLKAGTFEKYDAAFVSGIKSLTDGILKAVASLRTTLAMQGISLISELAQRVGDDLADASLDAFIPALLKMAGYTKRIVANAAQDAAMDLFQNISYRHRFMDLVWAGMQDKTVTTRISMAEHLYTLLAAHAEHRKHAFEVHDGLATIEKILKKGLSDQNKDVRWKSREAFYVYKYYWPARSHALEATLEPSIKKQIAAGAAAFEGPPTSSVSTTHNRIVSGTASPVVTSQSTSPAALIAGGNAGPSKRATGPSSAILAAKARMVAEKREQEARQRDSAGSVRDESYSDSTLGPGDSKPKRVVPLSQNRATSMSRIPRPADIPLPSSPTPSSPSIASAGSTRHATSPPAYGSARSRSGSAVSPSVSSQGTPRRYNGASGASWSDTSPGASLSARSHPQVRSQPFQPTRARNVSTSTAGSSSTSSSGSGGSLKARPLSVYNGIRNSSSTILQGTKTKSIRSPPGTLTSSSIPRFLDPDDTVQLRRDDADATMDGDATVDLMGMTSSPLRGAEGVAGVDDSLSFAFANLGQKGGKEDAAEEKEEQTSMGDETIQFAPTLSSEVEASNPINVPGEVGSKSGDIPVTEKEPLPISPAEGKSYLASRASRLTSQAAAESSPLKSMPDILQRIEDIRMNRADDKTFDAFSLLSRKFPVRLEDSDTRDQSLESGPIGEDIDVAKRRMQDEGEGEDDVIPWRQEQAEAWRDSNLFCRLWEALEIFILSLFAAGPSGISPPKVSLITAEKSLSLLHNLIERQYPLFLSYGLESDLLSLVLRIRASVGTPKNTSGIASHKLASSCEGLIDIWAAKTLPALGLSSLLTSMGPQTSASASSSSAASAAAAATPTVQTEIQSSTSSTEPPNSSPSSPESSSISSSSFSSSAQNPTILLLSLRGLSKLLLRLPPEMILEELPRTKVWISKALNDEDHPALRQIAYEVLGCALVRIEQGRDPARRGLLGARGCTPRLAGANLRRGSIVGKEGDDHATGAAAAGGELEGGSGSGGGGGGEEEDLFNLMGTLKEAQKNLLLYIVAQKRKKMVMSVGGGGRNRRGGGGA